ncbi:ABC transporter substrate-binding protein [Halomonas sp. TRM85114]|uniref:CmpA/NrtA family ABC transporter substrate-binding protein n=1 Tax=Halomonas jincaotanensis TaxID=2810616 RepID=UPI001BD3A5A5|nr:CmpA/NrtA family ABC transporter substrate-binding protein [Halomonas jincaotanensis]MBS9402974.1 ABC transporter substrate-binding protein [Halomonas jincaotanensis]
MTTPSLAESSPNETSPPELERLSLGFIPLLDAALPVIAREHGFFAEQGLDVSLSRENAWSTLRDKVAAGLLDGAHMLAPLPLAMSLGLGRAPCDTLAPVTLSRNGNTLTLSPTLVDASGAFLTEDPAKSAQALGNWQRRTTVNRELRLAMVYPFSCQHYLLREWLALGDLDPDGDATLVALPPQRMVDALKAGEIDGFCAGEPWGSLARYRDIGRIVATGHQLWPDHPEKVLGVTRSWANRYPATLAAMIRALVKAAEWLAASPEHCLQARHWLALPPYLDQAVSHLATLPLDAPPIHQRLTGTTMLRPDAQFTTRFSDPIARHMLSYGRSLDQNTLTECYSPVHFDAATHP